MPEAELRIKRCREFEDATGVFGEQIFEKKLQLYVYTGSAKEIEICFKLITGLL